jgi:hypothetical protein
MSIGEKPHCNHHFCEAALRGCDLAIAMSVGEKIGVAMSVGAKIGIAIGHC